MRNPDAIADIHLLSSEAGGRAGATPPDWFGCILVLDDINLDVRMRLKSPLCPGTSQRVELFFLSPHLAAERLRIGTSFNLRESGVIGSGSIAALRPLPAGLQAG